MVQMVIVVVMMMRMMLMILILDRLMEIPGSRRRTIDRIYIEYGR